MQNVARYRAFEKKQAEEAAKAGAAAGTSDSGEPATAQ